MHGHACLLPTIEVVVNVAFYEERVTPESLVVSFIKLYRVLSSKLLSIFSFLLFCYSILILIVEYTILATVLTLVLLLFI